MSPPLHHTSEEPRLRGLAHLSGRMVSSPSSVLPWGPRETPCAEGAWAKGSDVNPLIAELFLSASERTVHGCPLATVALALSAHCCRASAPARVVWGWTKNQPALSLRAWPRPHARARAGQGEG